MRPPISTLSAAGSLAVLALFAVAVVHVLGRSGPVIAGGALGLVLGWGSSAFELRLMRPHLHSDFPRALRILTAGFGLRVLGVLIGLVALDATGLVDGVAFAVGFVGGFFAFLPILASALRPPVPNGEARG
jgi:hypothetical protein